MSYDARDNDVRSFVRLCTYECTVWSQIDCRAGRYRGTGTKTGATHSKLTQHKAANQLEHVCGRLASRDVVTNKEIMRRAVYGTQPSSAQRCDVITSTLADDVELHACDATVLCTERLYAEF